MTDAEWVASYGRLVVAYPSGNDPALAAARGRVYRDALDGLDPAAWAYAVRQALARERFYPTIAALMAYADEYRPAEIKRLPAPPRTPEERDRDRHAARQGLELIRATLGNLPPPIRDWPIGARHSKREVMTDGTSASSDNVTSRETDGTRNRA